MTLEEKYQKLLEFVKLISFQETDEFDIELHAKYGDEKRFKAIVALNARKVLKEIGEL